MKRMRMMGLALVAVFALSVAASTATAAPVYYTKVVFGGTSSAPIHFTGTLGAAFLEPTNKSKITCTGGTAIGEVTGPTTSKKNITTFTGCEASGFKCNSAGEGEGVIKTKSLEGSLGGVTATLPGVRLFDEGEGKGGKLAEFTCAGGAITVVVKGSVIGSLSGATATTVALAKFASTQKLTFAEANGIQKYSKFVEGEVGTEQLESSTNGAAFEKSGQSVIATLKAESCSAAGRGHQRHPHGRRDARDAHHLYGHHAHVVEGRQRGSRENQESDPHAGGG